MKKKQKVTKTTKLINGEQQLESKIQADIYNIVNQLKNVKSINRAYRLLTCLSEHDEIVNFNDLKVNYPKEYEYEVSKFTKEYDKFLNTLSIYYTYLSYNRLLYTHHRLCSAYDKIEDMFDNKFIPDLKTPVSLDKSVDLVAEFFVEYDLDVAKFFLELIRDKKVYFTNDKTGSGTTYNMSEKSDVYVFVTPENNIRDAITLTHEVMHAYIEEQQKTINDAEFTNTYIVNYFEVYSIFIELVFVKYLKDKKMYEDDLNCHIKRYLISITEDAKIFKESEYTDSFNERYVYGFAIALHFYKQYLVNPKEAKENILKFMLETKERDKVEMLNDYGLNIENIQNEKKLQRYVKRYINRLEK